ncbi:MAG: sugar phosphate isomerase/epimerase [Planctomycetaceae bacterium]|jgi:sugar phosphate isomerase/epimerase|nr:sugar phosphate isomerase/epimerase [Planctomycetaceae bacterium]
MKISRRVFGGVVLGGTLGAVLGGTSAGNFAAGTDNTETDKINPKFPSKIYKARITELPTEKYCEQLKAAGYDGLEVTKWNISPSEAFKVRQLVEGYGLRIHSLLRAWTDVNDSRKFESDVKSVQTALRAAAAYGADTVLWVTCRASGGLKMPEAWDFDVDFDPKTLKVKTVAQGDNSKYTQYIAAQDQATEASIRAIESLIPIAAKEGVRIGLENVWNNFWCTPKFFAAFCKYFDSTWVGSYLDLGNHTKYSRCEEWIKELDKTILKLHIKGYKITEVKGKLGGGVGDWSKIDEASIDWRSVRKALADVRYNGWMSVEEDGHSNEKYSEILDKIIAGN